jgi:hypothetical protein
VAVCGGGREDKSKSKNQRVKTQSKVQKLFLADWVILGEN